MLNFNNSLLLWLNSDKLSNEEKDELRAIQNDTDEISERFSSFLTFGTAGLRGKMKLGTNAINVYTIAHATQGIANLIIKEGRASDGVAIAYDSRNNSEIYAKTAAEVLAANLIPAYIFDGIRPTPELSFAIRELKCVAGINITASHNPKEYNGYKAYWEDGAQIPPNHADTVSSEISKIDIFKDVKRFSFERGVSEGLIHIIGKDIDDKYIEAVLAQRVNPSAILNVADDLKIVYSPLHGAGYKLVPEVFRRCGLKHLYTVPEQMKIDGNFPTVKKPNPEYSDVFKLGINIAEEIGSDLIIATDPDSDRVGVMTRSKDGSFITISGNQMGALLLDYIITAYEQTRSMPENPYAVKTIVTTELASKICEHHKIKIHNVLTGFKFIGEVIKNHELDNSGNFIFGFEESYGYLKGTYARDKDAVVSSMLICEMTAYYKAKNMTLSDALCNLYERYGYFYEANREIYHEGLQGAKKIEQLMSLLRNNPPLIFGTQRTVAIGDYLKETITDFNNGDTLPTNLPKSNVIYYKLSNGDVIIARPSGTEPKIKFYFLLQADNKDAAESNMKVYNQTLDELIN